MNTASSPSFSFSRSIGHIISVALSWNLLVNSSDSGEVLRDRVAQSLKQQNLSGDYIASKMNIGIMMQATIRKISKLELELTLFGLSWQSSSRMQ